MLLTIYSRPGCHLCDEALTLAEHLGERYEFDLTTENIELDDDLHRRYLESIPVVEIDGVEVLRLDEYRHGGLERALESARGAV